MKKSKGKTKKPGKCAERGAINLIVIAVIALTGVYGMHVGNSVSEHGTKKATVEDVIAHVKKDKEKVEDKIQAELKKVTPNNTPVYNK